MNVGYVLVRTHKPCPPEVHLTIARLPTVSEVHPLVGEWDLLAKVDSAPTLGEAHLLFTITSIAGVIESKWLGLSPHAARTRVVSDLSNTPTRSDAL